VIGVRTVARLSTLVLAGVAIGCSSGGGPAKGAGGGGSRADAGVEAGATKRFSWASFGGDLAHSRANLEEKSISVASVPKLAEAYRLPAAGVTSTPAVVDGVVYWADWEGNVYANALDGTQVWAKKFDNGFSSSPAVSGGRLYMSDRKNNVMALDPETGDPVWTYAIPASPHAYLWSSPVIVGDTLLIGLSGYATQDSGQLIPDSILDQFRGAIIGLDAKLGAPKWRFETTVGPDGTQYGAGVSSWSSAAIDEQRKMAFIGTSNSYFAPAGPYSDSLLAFEYETGKLAWHQQFTEGDAFRAGRAGGPDADVGAAPNLFQANGKDAVGVGDKGGTYRVFDIQTGEPLWNKKLTVGSGQGGVMAPAAVAGGVVYVSSNESGTAQVFALNADTGDILWQQPLPGAGPSFGAPTYVNGVLLTGPANGTVYALDAKNSGTELWSLDLKLGHGGGFAVADGYVFTGVGYDYFNKGQEPLEGALVALHVTE
jgi:polyvinyl alcohol dehydrogenase (cytochrome)